ELRVDDLAGRQLHHLEDCFRIAGNVRRDIHVAPDLGLDAADVGIVGLAARGVRGFFRRQRFSLGQRLERLGFAVLPVANLGQALFLLFLFFRVALVGFALFEILPLLVLLELALALLFFLERDVGLGRRRRLDLGRGLRWLRWRRGWLGRWVRRLGRRCGRSGLFLRRR